jgi:hypothetical protein
MSEPGPEFSFRGLPLSAEQESEIQHYIHQRQRRGLQPEADELRNMLRDMLEPPLPEGLFGFLEVAGGRADAERAAGQVDERGDSIATCEERIAAGELEAMKHQRS